MPNSLISIPDVSRQLSSNADRLRMSFLPSSLPFSWEALRGPHGPTSSACTVSLMSYMEGCKILRMPSSPLIDPNPGAKLGFEITEQEQEGSAPELHVLPVIIKQEDKKHVNTHESSEKAGIPGPDAHARRPPSPAAPHDEPQEHTQNVEEPVQVLTDCVSKQYAGPSVPIQKSSLIGLSPALREIKRNS
jgi:hypothetical protein